MWSKASRYKVPNGIRQVMVMLTQHVPSHLTVAGYRVLLSDDGLPATCNSCGAIMHMFQGCQTHQRSGLVRPNSANATYASVVSDTAAFSESPVADMIEMGLNTQKTAP